MKPTPQRLALLISLIGIGLSQDARARSEEGLAAAPSAGAQTGLARGWASDERFAASRLASLSAFGRWPEPVVDDAAGIDTALALDSGAAAPAPPPRAPNQPQDDPHGPDAIRTTADPSKRDEHAPTGLALVDDDDAPTDDPDAATEPEPPVWLTQVAARMHFAAPQAAEASPAEASPAEAGPQDLASVLLADMQMPIAAVATVALQTPTEDLALAMRALDARPGPEPRREAALRPVAMPAPRPLARPTPAAVAAADTPPGDSQTPADAVMSTLAAVLSEHWTGPSHVAAIAETRARPSAKGADTRAPSQADRVLGTLSEVLATPGEAARDDADRDLASTLQVDVELEIDAMHVALELDSAHVELELNAPAPRPGPFGATTVAVNEHRLDGMRGGFTTDSGLRISFGIERAVYVNGNLVTTTSLNLSELGKLSGGQGQGMSIPPGSLTMVQNGAGNSFTLGPVSTSSLGTVIQNTLNDQKIQAVTTVNATVNSLGILKSMELQSNLRNAIVDSLRR